MPRSLVIPRSIVGVALSLSAVIFGVLTGILVKKLSPDITLVTTLFYRFLFSLPILFAVAIYSRGRAWLQINQRKTMCLRVVFGFCGICGIMFWFLSLRNMPFGLATTLFQSSVIFITLMSPFLLGEKVGIYRWSAVIAGLSGVVIITNPFSGAMTAAVLYGVGAALAGAVLSILLRRLGKKDSPISVACWYNASGFVALSVIVLIVPSQFHAVNQLVLIDLIFLGVIGAGMQIVLTSAYRYSDAVVVASMRYLQMPLSGVIGYVVFSETMSVIEIFGALVIISSCLVIAWRELVRAREVNQPGI
ncbi:MAG: DMT family transporter [Candidatus Puniceispirillaceae bacterium]